jgi:hypothetical protein
MPDKPKGPGKQERAPHETPEFLKLREQFETVTADKDKLQTSYDEHRSLAGRQTTELGELRRAKERLEELTGTTGQSLADDDARTMAKDRRADKDRYATASTRFMVRHGIQEEGLKKVETFVRDNQDLVRAHDEDGFFDYERILDTAQMHLASKEREEKLARFEKLEADARAERDNNADGALKHAGVHGDAAGEGVKQVDLSAKPGTPGYVSSDDMLDDGVVQGYEGVSRVKKKG